MMFGRQPKLPSFASSSLAFDSTTYNKHLCAKFAQPQDFVHANLVEAGLHQKTGYDSHSLSLHFDVGDMVWYQQQENWIPLGKESGEYPEHQKPGKCGNNRWKHGESGLCISIAFTFTSRRQPDALRYLQFTRKLKFYQFGTLQASTD